MMAESTMKSIMVLQETRTALLKYIEGLSDEQLLVIPQGSNNNILWHLGHIAVSQQVLHYSFSGIEPYVSKELIAAFTKGSSPKDWDETPDIKLIKHMLMDLPLKLEQDVKKGIFTSYTPYTTAIGVTLNCIEDAIAFNPFHEGMHFALIMKLKKQLSI